MRFINVKAPCCPGESWEVLPAPGFQAWASLANPGRRAFLGCLHIRENQADPGSQVCRDRQALLGYQALLESRELLGRQGSLDFQALLEHSALPALRRRCRPVRAQFGPTRRRRPSNSSRRPPSQISLSCESSSR